jgi:hypothetical protein
MIYHCAIMAITHVELFGPVLDNPPRIFVVASGNNNRYLFEYRPNSHEYIPHDSPVFGSSRLLPGAVFTNPLRFFVASMNGRVFERLYDGTTWHWKDWNYPPGTVAGSFPGAAIQPPESIKLFVYGRDGQLYELHLTDAGRDIWNWGPPHGHPDGTNVNFGDLSNPGPVYPIGSPPRFFVVTQDGRLFEHYWNPSANAWLWKSHGAPPHSIIIGSAGALLPPPEPTKFFVSTQDGNLYERRLVDKINNTWGWTPHGQPPGLWTIRPISGTPGALLLSSLTGAGPKFFVYALNQSDQGHLFERYWDVGRQIWGWTDHGFPPGEARPDVIEAISDTLPSWPPRFFVASRGAIWERQWVQQSNNWYWFSHGSPSI